MIAQSAPPRMRLVPEGDFSFELADAAVDLAARAGLVLDDWQIDALRLSLALRPDGTWAAGEIGLCLPRQNGKNAVTEARQLAALYLFKQFGVVRSDDPLAVHTAHLNDTSAEAFRRLTLLVESLPAEYGGQVRRISRANGKEAIEMMSGERIRYRARTKGGGRGYAGDDLYLDEAMFLPEFGFGSLRPILSARPNPQVWYCGSAVDQEIHEDGTVFSRVRERAIAETDPKLVYFEWSLPYDGPEDVPEDVATDVEAWAICNPALNVRILPESVEAEHRSMAARSFAVERLGVGDWPDTSTDGSVIDLAMWQTVLQDPESQLTSPFYTFDVPPNRAWASIGVAGPRADGLYHVELVDRRAGTGWLAPRLAEVVKKNPPTEPVWCDGAAAASLIPELEQLGVQVETVNAKEHAQACGFFFDMAEQHKFRHLGTAELTAALKGAAKRPLVDAWLWSRKSSAVDISPLVACTLALFGCVEAGSTGGGFSW